MMLRKARARSLGAVMVGAALASSLPASAHHSFAMFDATKTVSVSGTVKEFQWTNPHTWIQLMVDEGGKQVEYSIEGTSPNNLVRRGWTRETMKPGDKVTVLMNPLKNGRPGGSFVKVTLADGTVMLLQG